MQSGINSNSAVANGRAAGPSVRVSVNMPPLFPNIAPLLICAVLTESLGRPEQARSTVDLRVAVSTTDACASRFATSAYYPSLTPCFFCGLCVIRVQAHRAVADRTDPARHGEGSTTKGGEGTAGVGRERYRNASRG